jgi:hypothetical protein
MTPSFPNGRQRNQLFDFTPFLLTEGLLGRVSSEGPTSLLLAR